MGTTDGGIDGTQEDGLIDGALEGVADDVVVGL